MSTTLFIGDLSSTCSVDDLEKEFSKFGELADIRIKTDPQTRKSLSYGFVEFSNRKVAEKAKEGLTGVVLCGRSLRISWASARRSNGGAQEIHNHGPEQQNDDPFNSMGSSKASVHVAFFTAKPHTIVTEETLRNIFSGFGNVLDVVVKQSTKINNTFRGYGFVHYLDTPLGVSAAIKAVEVLSNASVNDIQLTCTLSRRFESRIGSEPAGPVVNRISPPLTRHRSDGFMQPNKGRPAESIQAFRPSQSLPSMVNNMYSHHQQQPHMQPDSRRGMEYFQQQRSMNQEQFYPQEVQYQQQQQQQQHDAQQYYSDMMALPHFAHLQQQQQQQQQIPPAAMIHPAAYQSPPPVYQMYSPPVTDEAHMQQQQQQLAYVQQQQAYPMPLPMGYPAYHHQAMFVPQQQVPPPVVYANRGPSAYPYDRYPPIVVAGQQQQHSSDHSSGGGNSPMIGGPHMQPPMQYDQQQYFPHQNSGGHHAHLSPVPEGISPPPAPHLQPHQPQYHSPHAPTVRHHLAAGGSRPPQLQSPAQQHGVSATSSSSAPHTPEVLPHPNRHYRVLSKEVVEFAQMSLVDSPRDGGNK